MRKIILSIIGLVLVVAAVFAARAIISSKKKPASKAQKSVKTIFVDTVQNKTVPIVIPASGNLTAKERIELYAEVQGIFRKGSRLFKAGQTYSKGQILIRIDPSEFASTVQSARSEFYNTLTSIMPDLRLDYPEVYPKWQSYLNSLDIEQSFPTLPSFETDQEKYFITGRNIVSAYYNIQNQERRLGKYIIRAPFSGVLTDATVTEGTLVRPGQKLGEFINTTTYELQVSVSKSVSDLLKEGEKVSLKNLNGTKEYSGKLTRINKRVDPSSQTVLTVIEVSDPMLKEGLYLEANIDARKEENAIKIDRNLMQEGNQIFVLRDSILGLIDVKPVFYSDQSVVLKNVPDGEIILSKAVPGAYAGMLVKVFEDKKSEKTDSKEPKTLTEADK
ncbi:multidrug efflux RND transporter periplasmic adaptor subunit VmeY [Gangjinia marincola]|uniref:Multidrug efflux RND transporter periplasmic adaptor subunit VmeY n=1 Tax=Gangjinia marincola TaxID=578463 RepID=A0ABN1ME84_9FLAO